MKRPSLSSDVQRSRAFSKLPIELTPVSGADGPEGQQLSTFQRERRQLLGAMAASAALTGAGCAGPPDRQIVPYAIGPEQLAAGTPVFYATALSERGYGLGALVECNDGRPTKVEGNPRHPASLGSTTPQMQAEVLQLWDPSRSSVVLGGGQLQTWQALQSAIELQRATLAQQQGAGLHVLMRPSSSPTLAAQLDQLHQHYPRMGVHLYDPIGREQRLQGTRLAFRRPLEPLYHFERARLVLTLDADFLQPGPDAVRYARDLIALRNPEAAGMSRIYAVESTPGLIGALADHRLGLGPAAIEQLTYRLAGAFGIVSASTASSPAPRWEAALIADLKRNAGACLVVAGDGMPPAVHALAFMLNEHLGTQGVTHAYIDPLLYGATESDNSLEALVTAANDGAVRALVILEGNPVYDAPIDLDFAVALERIPLSVHLSRYADETSERCTWHVPATHPFEHWSDLRGYDGTASIVQPLIAPLYGGHSAHELLSLLEPLPSNLAGANALDPDLPSRDEAYLQVRALWQRQLGASDFDSSWRALLRSGVIEGTTAPVVRVTAQLASLPSPSLSFENGSLQLLFVADQSVRAGDWANNSWLQELPRSASKITWGNAAYLSPRTAADLGVGTNDELLLEQPAAPGTPRRQLRVGVWVLPDQPDGCITLPLGYGRTRAGPIGDDVGFDAYQLRTRAAPWYGQARARRTGSQWAPALTQRQGEFNGRDDIVRLATLAQFQRDPHFATEREEERVPEHSLYPPYPYTGYSWAMTIDLNACIGCNACTIACQVENNIPTVGAEQVRLGRVMHWIRVDRYYDHRPQARDLLAPAATAARMDFQPVPCMQCEHAPCEEVCPVGATVHDAQGLNLQVYNRCIGTRFCSNNCPYKVRRFNFLRYSNRDVEALKALQNPDVTVRMRGVMEKCTYCLQRIERARIGAELEHRGIRDGEVVTACQAACPTRAIRFGNLNDPQAQIHQTKRSPRNYSLLAELNTRPRTTYLARVRNPTE